MKHKAMRTVHSIPAPQPSWTMSPADVGQELETERLGFSLVYDDVSRVFRGGGWRLASPFARVAFRNALAPAYRNDALGFRLCVDWREG